MASKNGYGVSGEPKVMMGTQRSEQKLFYVGFDLDSRVRPGNPLRRVLEAIDFTFVRAEVADCYGENGNVSVDPAVILKTMFLLFYDDVASERELMRIIPERLDYLWFLGYGLDDEVPNHSVLSKAKRRWGPEAFERFFVETVRQCLDAGLVSGSKIHMDGSLVDADASKDSVVQGPPEVIAALKEAYRAQEAKLDEVDEPAEVEEPQDDEKPADGPVGRRSYEAKNARMVSTTDPDAPIVRQGTGGSRPRYKHHRVVDDAHGVVTAVATTAGDVKENGELMGLVDQHERHTEREVEVVVADSQYGTVENFRACQERGIRSHMADLSAKAAGTGRRRGIFEESAFLYDATTDTYRCPAGETLRRRRHRKTRRVYEYAAGATTCAACPLREQCTRAKKAPRTIKRHEDQEIIDAARAESHSVAAKRDRRRRKHLMEGSFADAANNHGFKRARWRRLWRQRIQDLLIAAVQNIRILLRRARRRSAAAVEALVQRRRPVDRFRHLLDGLRAAGRPWGALETAFHRFTAGHRSDPPSASRPASGPFGQHALDM